MEVAPNPQEGKIELAQANLSWILDWTGRYDNKLAFVAGLDTGMLGLLFALIPQHPDFTCGMIIVLSFAIAFLLLSLGTVLLSSFPRMSGPKSVFFFGSVSQFSLNEYSQHFASLSKTEVLEDLLGQCHRNSEILFGKFVRLRQAYVALALSIAFWLASLYCIQIS